MISFRTFFKIFVIVITIPILLISILYFSNYDLFNRMPRVRVGALHEEVTSKDSLRLFVLGDTGSGNENQYAVAAAMEKRCLLHDIDAILLLGDNAYQVGMESVDDPQWQTKIEQPYGTPCLKNVPIYPVLGNHDYRSNPGSQIEYSLISPRWKMPNRFYSVDFSKLLRVVAIDSNFPDFCLNARFCSIDYMLKKLREPETVWSFVLAHHPIAAASAKGHGHSGGARGLLFLPLVCSSADLYLTGHAHMLEHRKFDGCRLQQFLSGGGGGDINELDMKEKQDYEFAAAAYGFLELEVTSEHIDARSFNIVTETIYETRIQKLTH